MDLSPDNTQVKLYNYAPPFSASQRSWIRRERQKLRQQDLTRRQCYEKAIENRNKLATQYNKDGVPVEWFMWDEVARPFLRGNELMPDSVDETDESLEAE